MIDSIIYGTSAIILPYKKHKKFTGNNNQKPLCKVTPFNNGEMLVLKSLSKRPDADNFLIPLIESNEIRINDKMPPKIKKFMKYLKDLNSTEKPKIYHGTFNFTYMLFKSGEIDLFDICTDIINFSNHYFLKNTNEKVRNMAVNLIDAVNFIHTLGICHFDIKPENIVLDSERFKLIDFGFAEAFPFTTYITRGPRGTMEYIPFNTNNREIINNGFSEIDPYIPCNDWSRNSNGWSHFFYGNNPSKNVCIKTSQIYKSDIYALGKTINRVIQILKEKENITIKNIKFINSFIERDVFKRPLIFDDINIPSIILENSDDSLESSENLDYNCVNFNFSGFFKTVFLKLKLIKIT